MTASPRVLVFQKRAMIRRVIRGGRVNHAPEKDPVARQITEARKAHLTAMAGLKSLLADMNVAADYVFISERVDVTGYDLVIALGGDGTVLHASHQIGSTPILGINSAPGFSVGYLSGTTFDKARTAIELALAGELKVTRLQRMAVDIDGAPLYKRVLNDILFSHECPASTARYILRLGEIEEEQLSSGLWVGPAAGSTAAQRAAGGRVLPPGSRKIQFIVREPYSRTGDRYELIKGVVPPKERLVVRNITDSARLYVDGPHVVFPVQLGETVEIYLSDEPLNLLGFKRPERPFDRRR